MAKFRLPPRLQPLKMVVLGVIFFAGAIWLGNDIGWDLTQTVGGGYRRGPAWLAIPGSFALGVGGIGVGISMFVQQRREARRAKQRRGVTPLFPRLRDKDGNLL